MRAIWLLGKSVLLEAMRRREIYALLLVSLLLLALVFSIDFFQMKGLTKFYREISLNLMSLVVALTVIVLATRQLPREFETRTIYPLLARPVSRATFLLGKLLGVMLAAVFGFALFMAVYVAGQLYVGGSIPWPLFCQYMILQIVQMLVLACLGFFLSMLLTLDGAITVGFLLFFFASTLSRTITFLHEYATDGLRGLLTLVVYVVPQLTLFDLSEKTIHTELWGPLSAPVMLALIAYGLFFAAVYFVAAVWLFRRRAL